MDVAILLFEGFDELDAIGPYEVFESAADRGATIETELVTLERTDLVQASHGLRVEPDAALSEVDPDLLVVPGGGWSSPDAAGVRREYERGEIADALATAHESGQRIASVCTGAMLLASGGILDGRPATTHHTALDDLRATDAIVRESRIIDDGDVLTAGGVTSGLDLALHVVEQAFGADLAADVARELEYERAI